MCYNSLSEKAWKRLEVKNIKNSWAAYELWDYEYFLILASLHFSELSKILQTACFL